MMIEAAQQRGPDSWMCGVNLGELWGSNLLPLVVVVAPDDAQLE